MDNIFLQKLRIPCYDTDITQSMKPVSFMNYAQEIANCHATILGFGYDDLIRTRTAQFLDLACDLINTRTWYFAHHHIDASYHHRGKYFRAFYQDIAEIPV